MHTIIEWKSQKAEMGEWNWYGETTSRRVHEIPFYKIVMLQNPLNTHHDKIKMKSQYGQKCKLYTQYIKNIYHTKNKKDLMV